MGEPQPDLVATYATRDARNLDSAELCSVSLVHKQAVKPTAAQLAGLVYEAEALSHLEVEMGMLKQHPTYRYWKNGSLHHAIPDATLLDSQGKVLCVIEVKLRHSVDPWLQLNHLYLPIVRKAHPEYRIKLLEVCKYYEPDARVPTFEFVDEPWRWFESVSFTGSQYGIYIWSGK